MPTALEWKNSGLIPTSGLLAWHMFEAGASGPEVINDYSGNSRHIDTVGLNPPALQFDVLNGQPAWYFNGATTDPLNYNGAIIVKHAFVVASAEDAAFTGFDGLLTGPAVGDVLVSNNSGTKFTNLGLSPNFEYRLNDVEYLESNQQAPMAGAFGMIEVIDNDGMSLNGIQVGQQKADTTRVWKGHFVEELLYDHILTLAERRRIMLYFNLKFALHESASLPFYFPSDDLLDFRRTRFYAEPLKYQDTTDSYEFEDRGRTFNEVADTPPRRWEYIYRRRTPAQAFIFDQFWDTARIANTFIFRDKYGTEWTDVRVEDYNRSHERHLSMFNDIEFRLVKYP